MAKASKKKPAKKRRAKKKIISSTDVMLPPKQRAKVLKKLQKMSLPPSHPSSITGPRSNSDMMHHCQRKKCGS